MAVCAVFTACDYEGIYNNDGKLAGGTSCSRLNSTHTSSFGHYYEKCSSFNGVDQIGTVTVSENTSIEVDLTVTAGKFKIILVSGKTVYTVLEAIDFTQSFDHDGQLSLDGIPAGNYKLRMAGVDASFVMTVTY